MYFPGAGKKVIRMKEWSPAATFTPDGKLFLASEGDDGDLAVYDAQSWTKQGEIKLNIGDEHDANINDVAVSADGKFAYVVDVTNEQFDVLDVAERHVVSRVKAGREPYALAFDAANKRVFVANIGLFDYSVVPKKDGGLFGITRPAFAFPSKEAEEGTEFEGRHIPGIGKIGTPDAQSVWSYDVSDPANPTVVKTAISGLLHPRSRR